MRKFAGRIISKSIHSLGYTIVPIQKFIPKTTGKNWAEKLEIKTIIDIGSNEGQFIKEISTILPGRKIVAFEPLPDCFKKLVANTKKYDITAYNVGLSDYEGTTTINVSNNLVSSSMLPMEDLHKNAYPESYFVKTETIRLDRLDDVIAKSAIQKNFLIKMDVQGYEEKVIKGGEKTFSEAAALIVESIFEPFYEGQWLFDDLYSYFTNTGFKFMGFTDQKNSKVTGIPLFADSIFIRKDLVHLVV